MGWGPVLLPPAYIIDCATFWVAMLHKSQEQLVSSAKCSEPLDLVIVGNFSLEKSTGSGKSDTSFLFLSSFGRSIFCS